MKYTITLLAIAGSLLLATICPAQDIISTVAGTGTAGYSGDGGAATSAELNNPIGLALYGNDLFIAEYSNNVIRQVDLSTGIVSTIAGTGTAGYSGDGGAATSAELYQPAHMYIDSVSATEIDLYFADDGNNVIRKVNLKSGIISTVAGMGTAGYSGDGSLATSAELYAPNSVIMDRHHNLLIADEINHVIRKVDSATGKISTIAGTGGVHGYSGDGGLATSAKLYRPVGLCIDAANNIYICDALNSCIRKVDAATGIITTVIGTGTSGYSGDGGPAASAELSSPASIQMTAGGDIYIVDNGNNNIRKIDGSTGVITTIAGDGTIGYSGDGGPATSAAIGIPYDIVVDKDGNYYIADFQNNVVRKVTVHTGVGHVANNIHFRLYPNPSTGGVTLQTGAIHTGVVTVYNMSGVAVYHTQLQQTTTGIDLDNQPGGIYFVQLQSGNKTGTQQIVISR